MQLCIKEVSRKKKERNFLFFSENSKSFEGEWSRGSGREMEAAQLSAWVEPSSTASGWRQSSWEVRFALEWIRLPWVKYVLVRRIFFLKIAKCVKRQIVKLPADPPNSQQPPKLSEKSCEISVPCWGKSSRWSNLTATQKRKGQKSQFNFLLSLEKHQGKVELITVTRCSPPLLLPLVSLTPAACLPASLLRQLNQSILFFFGSFCLTKVIKKIKKPHDSLSCFGRK